MLKNRIIELRKAKGLSQEKFGEKLGVTKSAISRMELGTYNVTDTMIKLICTEYGINEEWLRYGKGEMLIENDTTIVAELSSVYKLDGLDRKIIESYLKLSTEHRKAIKQYVHNIVELINAEGEIAASIEEDAIEKELNAYRLELEAEKKGTTLPASPRLKENLG